VLAPTQVPRLAAPAPADPHARGAAYLAQVALQLEPGWGQFLDDCRLRLPPAHPLNGMTLAASAEIVIDRHGHVVDTTLASSGNADFDRAVRDAIADAAALPEPPQDLLSDDDRLHVRWLFARDRRQAGPATAEVLAVQLPLPGVVQRLLAQHELARAARRVAAAPAGDERAAAIARLMTAALREALAGAEGPVRRAAVDAVRRAKVLDLAGPVRDLLVVTTDTELRLAAIEASAALDDREAAAPLLAQLPGDLPEHPRLAVAETRALVALGHTDEAAKAIRAALDAHGSAAPSPIALDLLALVPAPALAPALAGWAAQGDARTRAGACTALGAAELDVAWKWIAAGLRDPDATVRASCVDAVAAQAGRHPRDRRVVAAAARLRELAHERDRAVRARSIHALVVLDPAHPEHAADDPAAEVRAAYAAALAVARAGEADAELRALIDDRDPDVRAAAWAVLAAADAAPADRAQLAAHAATDPASQVRRAALPAVDDDDLLAHLAASDDAPAVRTEALVQLAGRRGRAAIEASLLDRLAQAPAASTERVRVALAWLLAR
jgi:hypothetical protein